MLKGKVPPRSEKSERCGELMFVEMPAIVSPTAPYFVQWEAARLI